VGGGGGGDVRLLGFLHMHGWRRAGPNRAGPSHTTFQKGHLSMRKWKGRPYMLLDELQHPSLDGTIQLRVLARCARVRREGVYEVRETVQHEYGAVPHAAHACASSCSCRNGTRGGRNMTTESRVLLPSRSNAHPYSWIDERIKRALNRRAVLRAGHLAVAVPIAFGFCRVQSEDRTKVLRVR
jgi:hypothetical protein